MIVRQADGRSSDDVRAQHAIPYGLLDSRLAGATVEKRDTGVGRSCLRTGAEKDTGSLRGIVDDDDTTVGVENEFRRMVGGGGLVAGGDRRMLGG